LAIKTLSWGFALSHSQVYYPSSYILLPTGKLMTSTISRICFTWFPKFIQLLSGSQSTYSPHFTWVHWQSYLLTSKQTNKWL